MAGKCSINVEKIKDIERLAGLGGHNNRTKIGRLAEKYIDSARSHLNYDLISCADYSVAVNEKLNNAGLVRKIRKDAVLAGSFCVNAPTKDDHELNKKFFVDCVDFISNLVGKDNVVSAQVHNDEKTPHLHLVFVPIIEKKNKKGVLTKCLSFKDLIGTKPLLTRLQTDFYQVVGKKYGLERGVPSHQKHITTREYRANRERVELLNQVEAQNEKNRKTLNDMQAWAQSYTNELDKSLENGDYQANTLLAKFSRAANVFAGDIVGKKLSRLQMANKVLVLENENLKNEAVQALATANEKLATAEKIQENFQFAVENAVAEKVVEQVMSLERQNDELENKNLELRAELEAIEADLAFLRTADEQEVLDWVADLKAELQQQGSGHGRGRGR